MAVGISIDFNAKRTGRYFDRLRRRFPVETKNAIRETAGEARSEVRRLMNNNVLMRRTSRLYRSPTIVAQGRGSRYNYQVGTTVPYGRYLELGFIHWRSGNRVGPFVIWRRVWRWAEERLEKKLKRLMERLL